MPKLKNKKTKRIKRTSKKNKSLGLFIIVGLFTSLIVWMIIKEPDINNYSTNANDAMENDRQPKSVSSSKKNKRPNQAQTKPDEKTKSSSTTKLQNPVSNTSAETKTNSNAPLPVNLDTAILKAIDSIGIPKSFYKRKKSSDAITYSIPIDRSTMDLLYANMIFKGELERNGGRLVKGTDSSNKQSLTFTSETNKDRYVINLYYDSKLYSDKKNPKVISIVVDDFGTIGGNLLDGFMGIDKEVCFAIFPDEPNSVLTMQKATAQGRETIIHVPMEPIGYPSVNPGKNAIFMQYSDAEIDKLLTRFIKQLPDCGGINNHMGSLATTDEGLMRAVMATLKKFDKSFLDSRTSNVSVAYSVAQKAHLKSNRNDLFLDSPNISQSNMDAKLNQIIGLSASKNNIIAITHCHNQNKLDYLKRIISRLKAAGFTLVPLSKNGQYNVPGLL
ncbi:MAG: divergent polysaccharide deacetylase family protein [Candidatus Cloacimonetes bacterium]|nr:divergent polysaccharide deacetylase family protein [Candidatus Cloacimonadota bacterium]